MCVLNHMTPFSHGKCKVVSPSSLGKSICVYMYVCAYVGVWSTYSGSWDFIYQIRMKVLNIEICQVGYDQKRFCR